MAIDLRSDTVTKPTTAMRRAMAEAEVGDDERDGDPTAASRRARRLAARQGDVGDIPEWRGMADQAAIWVMTTRATEVLVDAASHIVEGEIADLAALNGVQIRPDRVRQDSSQSADDLERAIRPPSRYDPALSAVGVENTHNSAGGVITPVAELRKIRDVARAHGLPVHLDGARLWNAAVGSGASLADFAACADTVMVAFSKDSARPSEPPWLVRARSWNALWTARKLFGGAMRQSGILAAGALYAIEHHMDRLAENHRHARLWLTASTVLAGPKSYAQTRTS